MDWFLYDNGLRHERVKYDITDYGETLNLQKKSFIEPGNKVSPHLLNIALWKLGGLVQECRITIQKTFFSHFFGFYFRYGSN